MKKDIYETLNKLITELREAGQNRLAEILDHRINKVAWTTSSELFDEIRNILEKEIRASGNDLQQPLKNQINNILKSLHGL